MGQCYLKGENSGSSNENVYASGTFELGSRYDPYRPTTVILPFAPRRVYFEQLAPGITGYGHALYDSKKVSTTVLDRSRMKITVSGTRMDLTGKYAEEGGINWRYFAFAE